MESIQFFPAIPATPIFVQILLIMLKITLVEQVVAALKKTYSIDVDPEKVVIQPTRPEFEGQWTIVVFPFTKTARKKPDEIAHVIGDFLVKKVAEIASYQVVKGFLNLTIADAYWVKQFKEIVENDEHGKAPYNGLKVMVEFSSPNTNKPLHLGHLRNIFLGYSVSQILAYRGYQVKKVNLVNDRGIHICKSMLAYQKFGHQETPQSSDIKGDHLVGKYYVVFDKEYKKQHQELTEKGYTKDEAVKKAPILLEAQEMLQKWEEGDKETVAKWKKMNSWVYDGFNATYDRMGVEFDQIYYESDTYLLGKGLVKEGLEKGIFYKKDDGSVWVDLTNDGLDEKLLLRADGTSVYITQDIGTADMRYRDFPFDRSVYVVGNEQDYHFKVLFLIMKKLGKSYANGLFHLSYGMVDLPGGKMKSREGTVVDADDLMDEMEQTAENKTRELGKIEGYTKPELRELYAVLGQGALKFFLLKVDPKKRILFDPAQSIEFQGYTGPFIQYTYARISAVLRKAVQQGSHIKIDQTANLEDSERALVLKLTSYPDVLEEAANAYSPATVAQYAYELAKDYNKFYMEHSILGAENDETVSFRLTLSATVSRTIRNAMQLLGITCPERM